MPEKKKVTSKFVFFIDNFEHSRWISRLSGRKVKKKKANGTDFNILNYLSDYSLKPHEACYLHVETISDYNKAWYRVPW